MKRRTVSRHAGKRIGEAATEPGQNAPPKEAAVLRADWHDPKINPKLVEFCRAVACIRFVRCWVYLVESSERIQGGFLRKSNTPTIRTASSVSS